MGEHFKTLSAVMLILQRELGGKRQILLQKRQNTGYMDGMWDCAASGHVERNESMKMALVREAFEELGIEIKLDDVNFASFAHKYTPDSDITYYNMYFTVTNYVGNPSIAEPEKCSELAWFDIHNLPNNLIQDRRTAIKNYYNNIYYDELDWSYNSAK